MTDITGSPEGGAPVWVPPVAETGPLTPRQAAEEHSKKRQEAFAPAEEAPRAQESPPAPPAQEDTPPPPAEAQSETQEADPAEQLPPIDPPKSWSKEDRQLFSTLPRETQERLAESETERTRTLRQRQNEIAEERKAAQAEKLKMEQARAQYEHSLPQLLTTMQAQVAGEFGDIRSFADVEKMQAEDPFRFQRFQLAQEKLKAVHQQYAAVQQRQARDIADQWEKFSREQDSAFESAVVEMADSKKAESVRRAAKNTLSDLGFKDEELGALWQGKAGISLRDARVQQLVYEAAKWREAQAKAKEVRAKPLPPVQKPGSVRPAGASEADQIQSLQKKLETSSGRAALQVAAQLQALQRKAKAS